MEKNKTSKQSHERRRSRSRKPRKLNAVSLIKLLRKHSQLTVTVCVVVVSLLTAYVAIELGA
jgi:hypothetical protein